MEPVTTLAYAVALAGAVSIQPMTLSECIAKEADRQQTLCVEVQPPCDEGGPCFEVVSKPKPQTKRVYYRKNGRLLYRTVKR